MFEVAACMILRPVAVPPVKAILSTSMLSASVCPTVGPGPRTSCALPGGKPAFSINSNSLIADSGVVSAGFKMQQLPAASRARVSMPPSAADNSTG